MFEENKNNVVGTVSNSVNLKGQGTNIGSGAITRKESKETKVNEISLFNA